MSTAATIIYPHQLFESHPGLKKNSQIYLIEDPLFFKLYKFHRQKLLLQRAAMKYYASLLVQNGYSVRYIDCKQMNDSSEIADILCEQSVRSVCAVEFDDCWLEQRVKKGLESRGIRLSLLASPGFLTEPEKYPDIFGSKKRYFFADFYSSQRKRLNILIHEGKPIGGKWSFDKENRKKLPKNTKPPSLPELTQDAFTREAQAYVRQHFPDAPGTEKGLLYPHTHSSAKNWLEDFIDRRLSLFGDYEDSISTEHRYLYHSVLSPVLNCGLLTPEYVLARVLSRKDIPLNSLEGFIRQITGWREYIRAMYKLLGTHQRNKNFFEFKRKLPLSFYTGSTGILPFDSVINSVLDSGYCHHIERLMVLGNFMFLCEIDPDEVYRWFMELFVDAYDWVMVPNVYGMSQYADGGMIMTKPYCSSSSYILKMSDYPKGPWCEIWDALYWQHISSHIELYSSNPRMSMMAVMAKKLGSRLDLHRSRAREFLSAL